MCDTEFDYKLKTRLYWLLNRIESWTDARVCCCICKKSFKEIDICHIESGYKRKTCCKKCERILAQTTCKDTMQRKYNVKNAFQLDTVKIDLFIRKDQIQLKREQTYHSHFGNIPGWNLKKSLETRKKKYNGNVFDLQKVYATKAKLHNNPHWNNPEKNFQTKKKNHTVNTSKLEEQAYSLLCNHFNVEDIIRQHKSDVYPFACDFFIKSKDLYIECNFSWTHGHHWFDEKSEEDRLICKKWKDKHTKYYDNAINTWTVRDVLKRKTAEANNLNYLVFWTLDEMHEYFEL